MNPDSFMDEDGLVKIYECVMKLNESGMMKNESASFCNEYATFYSETRRTYVTDSFSVCRIRLLSGRIHLLRPRHK